MKSITDCESANVYVDEQKMGSVMESPGFWRDSPAWTAVVAGPCSRRNGVGSFNGSVGVFGRLAVNCVASIVVLMRS